MAVVAVIVGLTAFVFATPATARSRLAFGQNVRVSHQKPAGWNEPSAIADSNGELYVATQNGTTTGLHNMSLFQSADGRTWHPDKAYLNYLQGRPEGQLGDVTVTADRTGTVFVGYLRYFSSALQVNIDYSRDNGKHWHTANDIAGQPSPQGASGSPFLVDRPWIAAYSPDSNYKHTKVYLEFHDFVTSDVFIVTCSMSTGSLQCGTEVPVSNPQTACNSLPAGVAVSPQGSKHPGRVYAVWETADPLTNVLGGCDYTQLQPFYALYVAWSDDPTNAGGWHDAAAYIGPTGASEGQNCPGTAIVPGVTTNSCADASELFTPIAVDSAGNVYVGFIDYISTLHKHYDVYVARSTDGGTTWDGKKNGSGKPILVSNDGGTHYIPQITAGSAGRVALIYYSATNYTTKPYTAGSSCPVGVPPMTSCQGKNHAQPPKTQWVTDVAESINAASAHPHFTQVQASTPGVVVHYGDICNLGIYCDGSKTGNRSMYENSAIFPDKQGRIVLAWTDQRLDPKDKQQASSSNAQSEQLAFDQIYSAVQTKGPLLFAGHRNHCGPPGAHHCGPTGVRHHRTHHHHHHHHPSHRAKRKKRGFTG